MHIILLCGGKQSGKTTSATAIYGYHLTQVGAIPNAQIDDSGRMSVIYDKEKNIYMPILLLSSMWYFNLNILNNN